MFTFKKTHVTSTEGESRQHTNTEGGRNGGGNPHNPEPSLRGKGWGNNLGLNPLETGGHVTPTTPEKGRARGGTKPNLTLSVQNMTVDEVKDEVVIDVDDEKEAKLRPRQNEDSTAQCAAGPKLR